MDFGVSRPFGSLKKVLVHRPGKEVVEVTKKSARHYLYTRKLNLKLAQREHDSFVDILKGEGVGVIYLEDRIDADFTTTPLPNAYFTRDFGVILPSGAVVNSMYYGVRKPEINLFKRFLKKVGIPIKHEVKIGAMEGGNMFLLPDSGILVGNCERTNLDGIAELIRSGLFKTIDIAQWYHTWGLYHLDVIFSMVPGHTIAYRPAFEAHELHRLASTYGPVLSITRAEQQNLATNLIPLNSSKVLLYGGKQLARQLTGCGFDVLQVNGSEVFGARGGPRCITLELLRE